jgi:hypothetical protein
MNRCEHRLAKSAVFHDDDLAGRAVLISLSENTVVLGGTGDFVPLPLVS